MPRTCSWRPRSPRPCASVAARSGPRRRRDVGGPLGRCRERAGNSGGARVHARPPLRRRLHSGCRDGRGPVRAGLCAHAHGAPARWPWCPWSWRATPATRSGSCAAAGTRGGPPRPGVRDRGCVRDRWRTRDGPRRRGAAGKGSHSGKSASDRGLLSQRQLDSAHVSVFTKRQQLQRRQRRRRQQLQRRRRRRRLQRLLRRQQLRRQHIGDYNNFGVDNDIG